MDKYDFMTAIFLLKDDVRYSPKDIYRKYCEVYDEFVELDAQRQILKELEKNFSQQKPKTGEEK